MKTLLTSLVSGLLFGFGLVISGMTNPAKVLGFLDVGGVWDPSLAFVMGGGVITTLIGYRLVFRRAAPFLADHFAIPQTSAIDARLILGAALFGIGWGLVGLCPGPAVTIMAVRPDAAWPFLVALLAGLLSGGLFGQETAKGRDTR